LNELLEIMKILLFFNKIYVPDMYEGRGEKERNKKIKK